MIFIYYFARSIGIYQIVGLVVSVKKPEGRLDPLEHFVSIFCFEVTDNGFLSLAGFRPGEILGKPIGSDAQENKNTYMVLYGAECCMSMIEKLTKYAKDELNDAFSGTEFLCQLADSMTTRLN